MRINILKACFQSIPLFFHPKLCRNVYYVSTYTYSIVIPLILALRNTETHRLLDALVGIMSTQMVRLSCVPYAYRVYTLEMVVFYIFCLISERALWHKLPGSPRVYIKRWNQKIPIPCLARVRQSYSSNLYTGEGGRNSGAIGSISKTYPIWG